MPRSEYRGRLLGFELIARDSFDVWGNRRMTRAMRVIFLAAERSAVPGERDSLAESRLFATLRDLKWPKMVQAKHLFKW